MKISSARLLNHGGLNMRNVSAAEREYALNNAVASVEIEGYNVSEYEKKMCMDVLNGNMTAEQFIQKMLES